MSTEDTKNGQQIRPGYLIFAGVAVIGMVVFWLMNQTQASPQLENLPLAIKPKIDIASLPTPQQQLEIKLDLSRNPFLAPGIVMAKKSIANPVGEEAPPTPLQNVNLDPPQVVPVEPVQEVGESRKPNFKGTLASGDDYLVMVEYQNKTHLLRLGDQLPGSKYLLGEIETDAIMLVSEQERLKVKKKEEAQ